MRWRSRITTISADALWPFSARKVRDTNGANPFLWNPYDTLYALCVSRDFLYRWLRVRGLHKRGRHTTWRHELAFCVFLLFLAGLASQTVVPRLEFGVGGLAIMGGGQTGLRINLIPFRIFADSLASGTGYFIINFLGNIGMFLPIGFLRRCCGSGPLSSNRQARVFHFADD